MGNRDTEAILEYHEATKHSESSIRSSRHTLDWHNQPLPFKIYRDLEPIALVKDFPARDVPALAAIALGAEPPAPDAVERIPDLTTLSRVLYLSAGITKRRPHPGGATYFRAYPNTGALYHVDLYLVVGDLPDLAAGVYHFAPHDFALRRLREGDWRGVLLAASGENPDLARAPVVIASASTYWRNSWKYQARAWRHCFWDAGTLHANLIAAAATEALEPRVILGWADRPVERLLGLDPRREGALTLVPLGRAHRPPPPAPEMPEIRLRDRAALANRGGLSGDPRRAARLVAQRRRRSGSLARCAAALRGARGRRPVGAAPSLHRRGASRRIARPRDPPARLDARLRPGTPALLRGALQRARPRDPRRAGRLPRAARRDALRSLPDRERRRGAGAREPTTTAAADSSLELLREGSFRETGRPAGSRPAPSRRCGGERLCLAYLPRVLERFGNRGYRAAQLEAAITGGRMYLAAYAQRFGGSGLTFFDDEVTEFFSPHAAGKSPMFLVALGYPDRVALGLAP